MPELAHRAIAPAAGRHQLLYLVLTQTLDLPQPEPEHRVLRHRLQRAVPIRMVDIDGPNLDPVLGRVADNLRRSVEAHRLTVQQRAGEDGGIAAFHPGRDIDQKREAGGVALGKAIIAEALDLLEAALGEVALIAALDHAFDHLLAKGVDRAGAPEGRHGPAQLIRLGRREPGGNDGDPHRLFLEKRHAQGLAEHRLQLLGGKDDPFLAGPPAQVGMHHLALDRSGANDRHLDHQIVEVARPEARQHAHLRPALDLEDTDGIGPAEHVIDR